MTSGFTIQDHATDYIRCRVGDTMKAWFQRLRSAKEPCRMCPAAVEVLTSDELLEEVFKQLSAADLHACAFVSRTFRRAATRDAIWRPLCSVRTLSELRSDLLTCSVFSALLQVGVAAPLTVAEERSVEQFGLLIASTPLAAWSKGQRKQVSVCCTFPAVEKRGSRGC